MQRKWTHLTVGLDMDIFLQNKCTGLLFPNCVLLTQIKILQILTKTYINKTK